ncbi:MAG: DUF4292 domain-containing protein [Haliscomenobacteraceae bacterium CHB4]|nr:DUF4292 domain-containing protein [Haliscomenobacteraceae bacterium CHB4]
MKRSLKSLESFFTAGSVMGNMGRILFIASLLCCLSAKESGCKRKGPSGPALPATEVRSAGFLVEKLKIRDVSGIKTLTARAEIFAEGEGQSVAANANIIWIRDSVLWVNVKKLGVEAARALVTKDSVCLINRLDKTYSIKGLESLQKQYSLPAGFALLQDAVLASAWFFPDIDLQSDIKEDLHRLSGSNGLSSAEYRLEEGSYLLRRETFLQQRDARVVTLGFDQYKKLDGAGVFPYLRSIEAYSPETGVLRLELELHDVEVNVPKNYRFEIPDHYERIE